MHEKNGRDETVGKILDSKRVSDMDAHERHALAKQISHLPLGEILKKFPQYRYE
jgi:hypothetical protein